MSAALVSPATFSHISPLKTLSCQKNHKDLTFPIFPFLKLIDEKYMQNQI